MTARGRSYVRIWAALAAAALAAAGWSLSGRAWWRRRVVGVAGVPETARDSDRFVAVVFPRLAAAPGRFTMPGADFETIARELSARGWTSIGFSDARDFYAKGRPLPPKAVLLAFDRGEPGSIALADAALARARMKACVFLRWPPESEGSRHALTRHALAEMRLGGAWEFGWRGASGVLAAPGLAFRVSSVGYDSPAQRPFALRIMRASPSRSPQETVRAIEASLPRGRVFADDFGAARPGPDWIVEHGAVSTAGRRLILIPLPRQKGASVSLNGTEAWSDQVVELTLTGYRSSFWLYARERPGERYLRVGAQDGFWKVEEKAGPGLRPRELAAAKVEALPARLRLTLKAQSAVVHIDGRVAFHGALRLDPRVDSGRTALAAYGAKRWNALGEIAALRARPLAPEWVAFDAAPSEPDADYARELHDGIVAARGVSPRWLSVSASGRVTGGGGALGFARAVSGFDGAAFAPMVELESGASWLGDPAARRSVEERLCSAARSVAASGLNLRVPASERAGAVAFAGELRGRLRSAGRRLWVTLDGERPVEPGWANVADGVLRPGRRGGSGLEILELCDREACAHARHAS